MLASIADQTDDAGQGPQETNVPRNLRGVVESISLGVPTSRQISPFQEFLEQMTDSLSQNDGHDEDWVPGEQFIA